MKWSLQRLEFAVGPLHSARVRRTCFVQRSLRAGYCGKLSRCVAARWSNTYGHNVSLFNFSAISCSQRSLAPKLGIKMRKKLKPDAVPTIFPRPIQLSAAPSPSTGKLTASAMVQASSVEQTAYHEQQAAKKRRPTYEKRERAIVRKT